jgi:hypothetical protein
MMFGENDLPGFTPDVVHDVSARLKLPSADWMQDWPIEVADAGRIQDFIDGYHSEQRTEHRSAIATLLIASLDEKLVLEGFAPDDLLDQVAAILKQHPELLGYWASWDSESPSGDLMISSWIRTLEIRPDKTGQ